MPGSASTPQQSRQTLFLGYDIRRVRCRTGCAPIPSRTFEARVLSLDDAVCERPSVLETIPLHWLKEGRTFEGLYPLFDDAHTAYKAVPTEEAAFCEIIGIAVALPEKIFHPPENRWSLVLPRGRPLNGPEGMDEGLVLEGFDVITLGSEWISAWTNCGLNKKDMGIDEQKDVTPAYLLRNYGKAEMVRVYADARIPSHAPFAVWSLYSMGARASKT